MNNPIQNQVTSGSAPSVPPGRDNIPLDHPRRIARIAFSHSLANETPEVQRLCAEHREKEKARHAALVASGYYGAPPLQNIRSQPDAPTP